MIVAAAFAVPPLVGIAAIAVFVLARRGRLGSATSAIPLVGAVVVAVAAAVGLVFDSWLLFFLSIGAPLWASLVLGPLWYGISRFDPTNHRAAPGRARRPRRAISQRVERPASQAGLPEPSTDDDHASPGAA
jgi:hypothetical protein